MKLDSEVSKCSVMIDSKDTSVSRLIKQFSKLGEKNFVIVVGYGQGSVISSVNECLSDSDVKGVNIEFIYNKFYADYGCEYSLSQVSRSDLFEDPDFEWTEDLTIVEGDLIISDSNLLKVMENGDTCVLCRSGKFLSKRSVAISGEGVVKRFLYDQSHKTDFHKYKGKLKDSMQVWRFVGPLDVKRILDLLKDYEKGCTEGSYDPGASGLFSINRFCEDHKMEMLLSGRPEEWMNLNTKQDLKEFNNKEWI